MTNIPVGFTPQEVLPTQPAANLLNQDAEPFTTVFGDVQQSDKIAELRNRIDVADQNIQLGVADGRIDADTASLFQGLVADMLEILRAVDQVRSQFEPLFERMMREGLLGQAGLSFSSGADQFDPFFPFSLLNPGSDSSDGSDNLTSILSGFTGLQEILIAQGASLFTPTEQSDLGEFTDSRQAFFEMFSQLGGVGLGVPGLS